MALAVVREPGFQLGSLGQVRGDGALQELDIGIQTQRQLAVNSGAVIALPGKGLMRGRTVQDFSARFWVGYAGRLGTQVGRLAAVVLGGLVQCGGISHQ